MLLEDLIQSFLVIADHTFCFTVCTVQGMIIKILKLKEKLFKEVREKLTAYKKDPSYEEYLERKIREAVTFAGNDKLTLYLDPSDEAHKASLEQKLSVTLTISAMPFLGGVRAVIPEKNILIDNSFETLLNEERENFIFHGGVEHE